MKRVWGRPPSNSRVSHQLAMCLCSLSLCGTGSTAGPGGDIHVRGGGSGAEVGVRLRVQKTFGFRITFNKPGCPLCPPSPERRYPNPPPFSAPRGLSGGKGGCPSSFLGALRLLQCLSPGLRCSRTPVSHGDLPA